MPSARQKDKVLGSWKEIAAYLGKGVRTVQRWEQELGLPVLRPKKAHKNAVLTSTDKLDQWVATKWAQQRGRQKPPPNAGSPDDVAANIRNFRRLRHENRELVHDLRRTMEELRGESRALVRALSREAKSQDNRKVKKPDRSSERKRS